MKALFTTLFFSIFATILFSQAPQGINYQAIYRNAMGHPVSQPISVTFDIYSNSTGTDPSDYSETHSTTSAPLTGLFNLKIGEKNPAAFSAIDWASGLKYLKVTINGVAGPVTEMLSVPYALYAKSAGNTGSTYGAGPGISINGDTISNEGDLSSTNEIQQLEINGNTLILSNGGGSVNLPGDADSNPQNEIQQLQLTGNTLFLTNGGGMVTLPSTPTYTPGNGISINNGVITNTGDADANPSNEIQQLQLNGSTLTLSNGGGSVNIPPDADSNPSNEIQTLSLAGNVLSLSQNGGSVTLASGTDSQTLSVSGNQLSISNGNTVALPQDGDGSSTNEIQSLNLVGNTLSLSNGGGAVNLPTAPSYSVGSGISIANNTISNTGDLSNTNELQTLTVTNNQLSISNGNTVNLPTGSNYTAGSGISINNNIISANDNSATNEIQQLQLAGDQLSLLPSGGTVTLPNSGGGIYINSNGNGPGTTCGTGFLPFECTQCANGFSSFKVTNNCDGNAIHGVASSSAGIKAGVFGAAEGFEGNGTWGQCNVGDNAWGVYGKSDSGYGIVGYTGHTNNSISGAAGLFNYRIVVSNIGQFNFSNWANASNAVLNWFGVTTSSDIRLKKDVEPINYGLNEVMQMKPVSYHWKVEPEGMQKSLGFIAQDMEKVIPNVIIRPTEDEIRSSQNENNPFKSSEEYKGEEPKLSMKYQDLIPVLVKAIQEQQTQIETLKEELNAKSGQVNNLSARLSKLENANNNETKPDK
ncbi:MAG: tail fiber domain-containing protein [Lewinellaceae bacterium]|nr:tail fiber domain-containing protein [Saprospiraceae bacterium]MCB9340958.1 tail fiber domain-containing protein [Lewinellaceae bacterium]